MCTDLLEKEKDSILVVDDDVAVRSVTTSVLEEFDYRVLSASDGMTALTLFRDHRDTIRLTVLDVLLPGKSGKDLFTDIRRIDPGAKILFTSGYGVSILSAEEIGCAGVGFLPKPSSAWKLIEAVRRMLAGEKLSLPLFSAHFKCA